MRNVTEILLFLVLLVFFFAGLIYIGSHTTWFDVFGIRGVIIK